MTIEVVNASAWLCVNTDDNIYYLCNVTIPIRQSYQHYFQPFAIVSVNKSNNYITAVRDHFGQEPLYYHFKHNRFIFGSCIKDVIKHLPQVPKISKHLIRDCFMRIPVDDPIDDPPYSTETYYESIFRVTPAHILHVDEKGIKEKVFWKLDSHAPVLNYLDERDYLAHFTSLLDEAIKVTTANYTHLAAEFSGGVDSATIFAACRKAQLEPALFTHIPPSTRPPTQEDINVKKIIKQYAWSDKHYTVDASDFDPMSVIVDFAKHFSGPAPNLNCVLSNNLHHAVISRGFKALLSGFGGDDCVSLLFPTSALCYKSLREYEYDVLQGSLCHEIRMRLEYSALTAAKMGFKYIYPLLYPPLVEFCFSLPSEQKFRLGQMRYTVHSYLMQYIKDMNFSTKKGACVPSTMQKCRDYYANGKFDAFFRDLPFQEYIKKARSSDDKMLLQIYAVMAKHGCQTIIEA